MNGFKQYIRNKQKWEQDFIVDLDGYRYSWFYSDNILKYSLVVYQDFEIENDIEVNFISQYKNSTNKHYKKEIQIP